MLVNLLKNSFIDEYMPLVITLTIVLVINYIVIRVFCWIMFKKAKIKPILSIVPILNYIKLIEMAELPKSTIVLLFIPVANIIAICRIKYEVSIRFGKGLGFSILYVLFPVLALYLLLPAEMVYTKLNYEEEKKLFCSSESLNDNIFKDFKLELKPGAVPFEESPKPYFEEDKIDLNVELKTIELGSSDSNETDESKKELVTVSSNEDVVEQAQKVEVDLNSDVNNVNTGVVNTTSTDVDAGVQQNENIAQKKKCHNCGVELDIDDDYCYMCGNDL